MVNLYDIRFKNGFYDKIDVVMSTMQLNNGSVMFNSSKMIKCDIQFPYCTGPVYIFGQSYGNKQDYVINAFSPDVDKSKLVNSLSKICNRCELSENMIP